MHTNLLRELPGTLAFMRLLWEVDHGLASRSKRMHASVGITGPQRLVVRLVGQFDGITPSELAALLHFDRGTMTGLIARLAERRLVERRADPHDGRRARIHLTARGRRIDQDLAGTVEACIRRALASVPDARIRAARDVLAAVARELSRPETARRRP